MVYSANWILSPGATAFDRQSGASYIEYAASIVASSSTQKSVNDCQQVGCSANRQQSRHAPVHFYKAIPPAGQPTQNHIVLFDRNFQTSPSQKFDLFMSPPEWIICTPGSAILILRGCSLLCNHKGSMHVRQCSFKWEQSCLLTVTGQQKVKTKGHVLLLIQP